MNYLLQEFTINPLLFRSIHYQGPSLNSLWILYLFCVFTENLISSLSILQWSMKSFFVRKISMNTLCVSWIYSGFTYFNYIYFANNIAQWFFRYRFIIFSEDLLLINYLFSGKKYEFTINLANSLWNFLQIYYDITIFSRIHCGTMEFTFCFTNSIWIQHFSRIYYLFREFTMDLLSNLRIHNEFTIFFANVL